MCKINWEERFFEVAKDLYVRYKDIELAFIEAGKFIEAYREAYALATEEEQKEDKPKKSVFSKEAWKEDFDVYAGMVESAREQLLEDSATKEAKEKYYPNIDYALTLDKMVNDFWGTKEGWEYKKKHAKKTVKIDMVSTLKKGFDMSHNRVYKRTGLQKPTAPYKLNPTKLDKGLVKPKDGTNPDGTFNKNGFRYYHSVRDNFDYSIPLNAPAMPNFECEFDCVNQKWYNPNETTGTYGELW